MILNILKDIQNNITTLEYEFINNNEKFNDKTKIKKENKFVIKLEVDRKTVGLFTSIKNLYYHSKKYNIQNNILIEIWRSNKKIATKEILKGDLNSKEFLKNFLKSMTNIRMNFYDF